MITPSVRKKKKKTKTKTTWLYKAGGADLYTYSSFRLTSMSLPALNVEVVEWNWAQEFINSIALPWALKVAPDKHSL